MILQAVRCEFVYNNRSGIVIDDFWKGPVILEECKLTFNKHSGIILTSNEYPDHHEFFKSAKELSGSLRKLNTSTISRVVPSNLFEELTSSKPTSY